jgi:hypothetical protein
MPKKVRNRKLLMRELLMRLASNRIAQRGQQSKDGTIDIVASDSAQTQTDGSPSFVAGLVPWAFSPEPAPGQSPGPRPEIRPGGTLIRGHPPLGGT